MWKVASWRLGKERKSAEKGEVRSQNTENRNNNNVKSNNTNTTIEGDTHYTFKNEINYYGAYPELAVVGRPKPLKATVSSLMIPSSSSDNGSSSLLTSATTDTDTAVPQVLSEQILESSLSSNHPQTVRSAVSQSTDNASFFSGAGYPLPQPITSEQLKDHVPNAEKYIKTYMSTIFFGSSKIIPLWNPSPGLETDPQEWKYHVDIGDVGTFNDEGGFDTLFNIFLSKEENLHRHYTTPDNFVHCPVNPKIKLQDVALPTSMQIKARGFAGLPNDRFLMDLSDYRHGNSARCAALYLPSGYRSATIGQYERPDILEYIRCHQESWQLHVEHKLQGRPLLIVFSSFRTKTCAMAAGTKPGVFKSWKPMVTLREFIEGSHKSYVWETNDNAIHTNFSPSQSFRDSLETYILGLDDNVRVRKGLEECHCVAVRVYGVQKRGWIMGGSVNTGKSSNRTVKPFHSIMSLPARFRPSSIREETGY